MAAETPPVGPTAAQTANENSATAAADYDKIASAAANAAQNSSTFTTVIAAAGKKLTELSTGLKDLAKDITKTGSLSVETSAKFELLTAGAINVTRAFDNLGGIDTSSLGTFGSQLDYIQKTLLSGTLSASAYNASFDALKESLAGKYSESFIAKAANAGVKSLISLVKAQTEAADNGMRLEASYLGQMAAAGQLDRAYEKGGATLGNLNNVMQEQANMIADVGKATNRLPQQVHAALGSFAQIPGSLDSVIEVTGVAGGKLNGLTASMMLADGVHRSYADVNKDVAQATKLFTTTTQDSQIHLEKSLALTAGLTEVSTNLGLSFDIVHKGIMGAGEALADYTDAGDASFKMMQGIRNISNEMAGGLMAAGMSGEKAMRTIGNMTKSMEGLSTAQKAFLSSQTGGPGGLMGAAQIEQMIRKGDIEGVRNKVMQSLKKQMGGNIVSLEDATQSQSAAAQYNKQKMLLDQGPLGKMVGASGMDSAQMIEFMKTGQRGGGVAVKSLSENNLSSAINRGSVWQEKTHGVVSDIAQTAVAIENSLLGDATSRVQMAQGTGGTGNESGDVGHPEMAKDRAKQIELSRMAQERGGVNAYNSKERTGLSDSEAIGKGQAAVITDVIKVGSAFASSAGRLAEMTKTGIMNVVGKDKSTHPATTPAQDIANAKASKATSPPNTALLKTLENTVTNDKKAINETLSPANQLKPQEDESLATFGQQVSPGATLAQAPRGTPQAEAPANTEAPRNPRTFTVQQAGPDNIQINVQVTATPSQVSGTTNAPRP